MKRIAGLIAAASAFAQTAGTRAVVTADSAPVYAKMTTENPSTLTLKRGEVVVIGMVLFGDEITWCVITRPGETRRLGYVSCELVGPEKASPPPAESRPPEPPAPAPPPPASKAKPVVRELPATPLKVRELTPVDLSRISAPTPPPHQPGPAPRLATEPLPAAPKPIAPVRAEPVAAARTEPPPVRKPEPVAPARTEPAFTPKPEPVAPVRTEPAPARSLGQWALDDSGLASQFAAYVRATSLVSFLEKSRMQEIETGLLNQILSKHFTGPAFSRGVAARIAAASEHGAAVSRFLTTPAARAAGDHLRRATQPGARDELVAFAAKLRESPPDPARLLLIHRVWNATRSSDIEVDTTMTLVRATALALNPILPSGKQFTPSSLDTALGQVRTAYLPVMKNARVVQYLFAFDGMPTASLEAYADFWESPPGQWLTAQVRQGFADAARTVSRNLTAEIARRGP